MTLALDGFVEGQHSRFVLDDGRYRIGRNPFNDIHISSAGVSREHAELIVVGGRAKLRDLGSRNGTFLNGERVHDMVEMQAGQLVGFADIDFKLVVESDRDWKESLRSAPLAAPEMIRSSPSLYPFGVFHKEHSSPGGPAAGSSVDGDTVTALLDAVVLAGRLCVAPRSPVDLSQEVCKLIHRTVTCRRTAVLLSVFPDQNPHLLAMYPVGADQVGELLLSEEEWNSLATRGRTLTLERVKPNGSEELSERNARAETMDGPAAETLQRALAIPLMDRGRFNGALYIEGPVATPEFTFDEKKALGHFSDLLALQLTDARLIHEQRRTVRLRQEISLAAQIQNRMLGRTRGMLIRYEALARQIPCFEVGGDMYDITTLEDGRMVLVLGDVVGKGMGAALLMSNALAALRILYPQLADPGEIVTRLHHEMLQASEPHHFVTLFLGVLDPDGNLLHYVNAGHCPPIVMGRDGNLLFVPSDGPPVGAFPDVSYRTQTMQMPPDSVFCMFSDGIPEAESQEGFYGEERLAKVVRSGFDLELEATIEGVISDLRHFVGEEPLQDDVTILLLRRRE